MARKAKTRRTSKAKKQEIVAKRQEALAGANGSTASDWPLPDGATADTTVVDKGTGRGRQPSPGMTERSKRVREWKRLKRNELLAEAEVQQKVLSEAEAKRLADKAYEEFRVSRNYKALWKAFEASEPSSVSVDRRDVNDNIELAAVLWHPIWRWLTSWLLTKNGSRGFAAKRRLVLGVFIRCAVILGRPEIARHRRTLLEGHTQASWAHGYPDAGPARNHFYESMKVMLRNKPAAVLNHVNIALLRQLAELRDENGELKHPSIGKVAIVDGSLVQADVEQTAAVDDEHRSLLYGVDRDMVTPVVYRDPKTGKYRDFTVGYKLMVLVDMATTLPMVFCLIPARGNERQAARVLLDILFAIWPDCPHEILVGDAAFDNDEAFAHDLVFRQGIHPIFARHGKVSGRHDHAETEGVPRCGCGELMKLHDTVDYFTAKRRAEEGIPRGEEAGLQARIRWNCVNGTCKQVSTRPFKNPRLYTYYPRCGEHKRARERSVYLLRRLAVESVFSSLQHLGLAGKGHERPGWAHDPEMDWLLALGLTYLTARRVAHETGMYEAAEAECSGLGLREQPSRQNPAPGPTAEELAETERRREEMLGEAHPPASWPEEW